MGSEPSERKSELIEAAVQIVHERIAPNQVDAAESFIRQYFKRTPPADLSECDPLDLYGCAMAHFQLARTRQPGETKVRVYNPKVEQHGWSSTHTVVEVVIEDMPFLVDSVSMAAAHGNRMLHLTIHPVMSVVRDQFGTLTGVRERNNDSDGGLNESFMHFEIDRQSDQSELDALKAEIETALNDVRASVRDWRAMGAKIDEALDDLRGAEKTVSAATLEETCEFLRWIADNHFTFLGYGTYDIAEAKDGLHLERHIGSELGILGKLTSASKRSRSFSALPQEVREGARSPVPLIITKANARSTVHRRSYLDYIGVKRFNDQGEVIGEHRFLGLFTSAAYNRRPVSIPLLRQKVGRIMDRAAVDPHGHTGKALLNILENYPRDELFQADEDQLYETAIEILHLQERQRFKLFVRPDTYGRFVACLLFAPRDRYNTDLRRKMQRLLQEAYQADEVEFQAQLSEDSVLARILFTVRMPEGRFPEVDPEELERKLAETTRSWTDILFEALNDAVGEEDGNRLYRLYGEAMPVGYRDYVTARAAVADIRRIDHLANSDERLAMSLYRPIEVGEGDVVNFRLIQKDSNVVLSDALPVLENMGLRVIGEHGHKVPASSGRRFWIHDFHMRSTLGLPVDTDRLREDFHDAFGAIWRGDAENDGFNRLILGGGLSWREVVVLRAYCKYMLQVGSTFSQSYIEQAMAKNAELAACLANLFVCRFNPDGFDDAEARGSRCAEIIEQIQNGLENVANLDEDRIVRRFLDLIQATLRTNAYQPGDDGGFKTYLSFKVEPKKVPGMPEPRPAYEIFVYSPRVEGVHLRGGKVARGGLRWSDRKEDFRTEVLGLVKAQMVKNSVIVPVGAKGGFYVKQPPADRAKLRDEGVRCYQTFIRGLLDITDNRVAGMINPPPRVVRYDQDDPYLVVAADKGTATFSDIANAISKDYGFWLGDAFASGGSDGYDHKAMGITAKGAWESVKRHFYELGKDCQREPFTCVGVGDMSGDVFGNGMLLSEQIRLIAAFDHRDIFIDPDPDPATSYAERLRMFDLPRSTWQDYDKSLISKGGGVFPRSAKAITLSPEAKAALGIDASVQHMAPSELLNAILKAPVELLWNGGIGTYVKASFESHADAQDRANDSIRVDGRDLRCKVVGEGGNLGLTQYGRIEFARRGGRVNTDFIDNSAGVDCSDHEVNIKILLGEVVTAGDMTEKQRNELLREMTDEVGDLVLRDNILQNQALSTTEAEAAELLDAHIQRMCALEREGRLSRPLEDLPDDEMLAELAATNKGLTRPELSVLLAYDKNTLYDQLLGSDLPDEPYLEGDLIKYFPRPLRKRFQEQICNHQLKREIIATAVANSLVNRGVGPLVQQLEEETGAPIASIARAYIVTRESYGLVPIWGQIEALQGLVASETQLQILRDSRTVLERGVHWFLTHLPPAYAIDEIVNRFAPGIARIVEAPETLLTADQASRLAQRTESYIGAGVAADLAGRVAALPVYLPSCDIVEIAADTSVAVEDVARRYFAIGEELQLERLRNVLASAHPSSSWQRMAISSLRDDLGSELRRLTSEAIRSNVQSAQELTSDAHALSRFHRLVDELENQSKPDMALVLVTLRALGRLAGRGDTAPLPEILEAAQ